MLTIEQLLDYLDQFPRQTRVLLHAADADALPEGTPHIVLDVLDFQGEGI